MVTIEEAGELLDQIAEELPKEFYKDLNGGIILFPESKLHPESVGTDLYIMGEYCKSPSLGRNIIIYYGSIEILFGHFDSQQMKEKLRKILVHEFTHHLESLAGEIDLEIEDAIQIESYKRSHNKLHENPDI